MAVRNGRQQEPLAQKTSEIVFICSGLPPNLLHGLADEFQSETLQAFLDVLIFAKDGLNVVERIQSLRPYNLAAFATKALKEG